MCSEVVLVPIPDLLWDRGAIFDFKPDHTEYDIDAQGRWCLRLDACIVPAVRALWQAGIATMSCCCGHGNAWGVITVQSQEQPDARGAMVLRAERYEELQHAEARAADLSAEVDRLKATIGKAREQP